MNKLDLLKLARQNLWRRKIRTFLTTLGVIIGTTAIVVMLSLGIGLQEAQTKSMESWGSLTSIRVQQGMSFDAEGNPIGEMKSLDDDAVAEFKEIEGVLAVSPAYNMGGEAKFGRKRGGLNLIGIDPGTMPFMEFEAEQGRLMQAGDRGVIVLGRQVINNFRDESFYQRMEKGMLTERDHMRQEETDPAEAMDKRITMTIHNSKGQQKPFNFLVVGILEGERGEHSYNAYVPLEDVKRMKSYMSRGTSSSSSQMTKVVSAGRGMVVSSSRSSGSGNSDNYDFILVRTADVGGTQVISEKIKELGYNCWSIADQLEGIEKTFRTIQAVLGGIGGITLLVAALGITNTMIMSIYERTREIGIMKVIGATFIDIHSMFLAEAGMIGFLGGLFGIGLGYAVSGVINYLSKGFINGGMPTDEILKISLIPPWLVAFALLFSIFIGILAGLYPAHRAVKLSPINAIRNE